MFYVDQSILTIKGVCAEKTSPRKRRGHAVTEMVVGPPLSLYRKRKQTTLRGLGKEPWS